MTSPATRGLGRTDLRFLLPAFARSVALPADAPGWAGPFTQVGLDIVPADRADVVFARAGRLPVGAATGSRPRITEGGSARRELTGAGLAVHEYLPLPHADLPSVVVPIGAGPASGYLVRRIGGSPGLRRTVRNHLADALLSTGHRIPLGPPRATVGLPAPGPPFAVGAAREFGIPADVSVALIPGAADLLSRGVLVLFPAGSRAPEWVIKFARVPDVVVPFDRDEHGLQVASAAGGVVTAHVPRLLGRMELDGLQFSVETAATGQSLVRMLESRVIRRVVKERLVERIAGWLTDVASATARPAPALAPEVQRIRSTVLPNWGAPASLADALERTPAVLAHMDPGTWNMTVENGTFAVLDWEDAVAQGPPIWDLVYFLAYAALLLDDADLQRDPAAHVIRVFRGESPSSTLVLRCVRRGAQALGLSAAEVSALAATCWLHHGMSRSHRSVALEGAGGVAANGMAEMPEQLARGWMEAGGLGLDWPALRAG